MTRLGEYPGKGLDPYRKAHTRRPNNGLRLPSRVLFPGLGQIHPHKGLVLSRCQGFVPLVRYHQILAYL